jgi:hypothetical protein
LIDYFFGKWYWISWIFALRLVGIEISIKEKMINKNIGFLILLIINNSLILFLIADGLLYIGYKVVTKHLKRIDYYH